LRGPKRLQDETMLDLDFQDRLAALRPKLHRYCARMTGSVLDGEDVVQDALLKATRALERGDTVTDLETWLFRIAHNAAVDFVRRRARANAGRADDDPELFSDPDEPVDDPAIVEAGLQTFMRLPAPQRAAVILMDVLGYRLQEICGILGVSLPAVKSSLHRGRARLRELAREFDERPQPALAAREQALLAAYVERFNARDFDAVRAMLADEATLDLVGRERREGKQRVALYFDNYASIDDWELVVGTIEGRPAVIVRDRRAPARAPMYFVLLVWEGDRLSLIRDFRYARYVMGDAEIALAEPLG
jgi:RNA polymerase sigma-70 factor (ECF subfamily)